MTGNGNGHAPIVATRPGLTGTLTFKTRHIEGAGRVDHTGNACLVDMDDGMLLFVDLDRGFEFWLHTDEVREFVTRDGAS